MIALISSSELRMAEVDVGPGPFPGHGKWLRIALPDSAFISANTQLAAAAGDFRKFCYQ